MTGYYLYTWVLHLWKINMHNKDYIFPYDKRKGQCLTHIQVFNKQRIRDIHSSLLSLIPSADFLFDSLVILLLFQLDWGFLWAPAFPGLRHAVPGGLQKTEPRSPWPKMISSNNIFSHLYLIIPLLKVHLRK